MADPEQPSHEEDEKPRTVFVGNIPSSTSKWDIESVFGEIGPLKRCYIQYPRNFNRTQSDTTVAYVTYALSEDAAAAVEKLKGHSFGTNKLSIKLSKSREEVQERPRPRFPRLGFGVPPPGSEETVKQKQPRVKTEKKKARLIIRNLPFQMTEEKLRAHFNPYGDIKDLNILKKPNGKLVGCAFIQYSKVSQAAKALRDLNLKPLMGRPIAIDWALAKAKFQSAEKDEEIKEESDIKNEDAENLDVSIKEEPISDDEEEVKPQSDKAKGKKRKRQESSSSDSDSEAEGSDAEEKPQPSKARKLNPNDADEGKTLFIRNLSFDTTSEKLKEFFLEFGPINYAVVCKDRLTEHSKGTAFVMFRNSDELHKCLQKYEDDPDHFILDERQFYLSMAMSKSKLDNKLTAEVHKEPKDKRNLYLVREGFIRPGTPASNGISVADVNLRAALHHHKRQMLKDLNNFISDKRLCVHNLPEKFSDSQLRALFLKYGGPGAKIIEARIMRDKSKVTSDGFKSKSFGFVTFTDHQHALAALRALNNNPNTFSKTKRPVVEFSLEKRAALKTKEKRLEKSKERLKQIHQEEDEAEASEKRKRKKKGKLDPVVKSEKKEKKSPKSTPAKAEDENDSVPEYGGLAGKIGISSIPSMKPKGMKLTKKTLKPKVKKLQPRRKREPKSQSRKNKGGDDQFEKKVAAYKEKNYAENSSENVKKKSKWYV